MARSAVDRAACERRVRRGIHRDDVRRRFTPPPETYTNMSDETEIPVTSGDTTDDSNDESLDMAAEIEELRDQLGGFDPENVAVMGCVVVLKEPTEREGEDAYGRVTRVMADDVDGFESIAGVAGKIRCFNRHLDRMSIDTDADSSGRPSGGIDLGDLLG